MREYHTAVVLAAGKGSRMGTATAKQYLEIEGKTVLQRSLEAFQRSELIDGIVLMTDQEHVDYCQSDIVEKGGLDKVWAVRAGGSERYESVWKALCAIKEAGRLKGCVLTHDAARPFVSSEIIARACEGAKKWGACVVGMPVKDTIKLVDEEQAVLSSPDRRLVWQAQTPQAFEVSLLMSAFERQMVQDCSGITDDAMVVERQMGIRAHMVEGSYENIKITTPEDLEIARLFSRRCCCAGEQK